MLVLKHTLIDNNYGQAQFARDIGLSPSTVAQLVNKEIWPKTPAIKQLKGSIVEALKDKNIEFDDSIFKTAAVDAAVNLPTEEVIDMLLRKQTLKPAAKKLFSLFKDPFDNDVQGPEDVFKSKEFRFVQEFMWDIAKGGGFAAIVGESGAGKSTLREDLEDRIIREDAPIIVINPIIRSMDDNDKRGKVLKSSNIEDAIIYTLAPLDRPKQSMEAKGRQVQKLLEDSCKAGFRHCLVIEEAHALAVPTLKHLKRFFEMKVGFTKLLSVVLIGQTELKTKLSERSPEVREVVNRCQVVELVPLDDELEAYLKFKLARVGSSLDAVFEKGALDAIRERLIFTKPSKNNRETSSLMYPLMVNNLVTASMNMAAQLGLPKVSFDLIKEA